MGCSGLTDEGRPPWSFGKSTAEHAEHQRNAKTMNPFIQTYEKSGINRLSENFAELIRPFGATEMGLGEQFPQRMCERKRRYDRRDARTAINAFAKQRGRHGRPANLRAYPCPFCAGWHLTKADCDGLRPIG